MSYGRWFRGTPAYSRCWDSVASATQKSAPVTSSGSVYGRRSSAVAYGGQAGKAWAAEPTSRPDDRLYWLDTVDALRGGPPPGSPSRRLAANFWLSHESTTRKQCLVRSLPARPASGFAPSGDEQLEQSRRAAITRNESSHGLCRGHGRSHATILPPSNGAISGSSALQKDHSVFLVSPTPPPKTNDLYQMVLHPPVELAGVIGMLPVLTLPARGIYP